MKKLITILLLIGVSYTAYSQIDITKRKVTLDSLNARQGVIYVNDTIKIGGQGARINSIKADSDSLWIETNLGVYAFLKDRFAYADTISRADTAFVLKLADGKIINDSSDFVQGVILDSIWSNINSAARLYGGRIYNNGDGSVAISGGAGLYKQTTSALEGIPDGLNEGQGGKLFYVKWDSVASLTLIDNAYNYIYFDGADSTIKTTADFYSISFTQAFTLGRAYRAGTDVVARLCGTNSWNFLRRLQLFGEEVFPILRATGLVISDAGNLQFDVTEGVLHAEILNRFSVNGFDGSAQNFTYWYRDGGGGFTSTTASKIDSLRYDNGSGTLATLANNEYGAHWVYVVHNSTYHVVYGRDTYTSTELTNLMAPATLPGLLGSYATLIGLITIEKGSSTFNSIQTTFDQRFSTDSPTDHNDLAGLQGGAANEFYHFDLSSYNLLNSIDGADTTRWGDNGLDKLEIESTEFDSISSNKIKNPAWTTSNTPLIQRDGVIKRMPYAFYDTTLNGFYGDIVFDRTFSSGTNSLININVDIPIGPNSPAIFMKTKTYAGGIIIDNDGTGVPIDFREDTTTANDVIRLINEKGQVLNITDRGFMEFQNSGDYVEVIKQWNTDSAFVQIDGTRYRIYSDQVDTSQVVGLNEYVVSRASSFTSPLDTLTINDSIKLNGGIHGKTTTESFASSKTISFANQHDVEYTVTGATTITFEGLHEGSNPQVSLIQDGTGGHSVTIAGTGTIIVNGLEQSANVEADFDTQTIATGANSITKIQLDEIAGTIYYYVNVVKE